MHLLGQGALASKENIEIWELIDSTRPKIISDAA
jgi:hypothetical protein